MKILVTDVIAEEAMEMLKKNHDVTFRDITGEELAREIAPYHALMVRSGTKVTEEAINNAENMVVIGRAGIGVDNIDIASAAKKGIKVHPEIMIPLVSHVNELKSQEKIVPPTQPGGFGPGR